MFTGIIQKIGLIERKRRISSGAEFVIQVQRPWRQVFSEGESIAVEGVCLTVTQFSKRSFTVQAVPETLKATTLGGLGAGSHVNLERSLRLNDSIGGHFVFGHVDTCAKLIHKTKRGKNYLVEIDAPRLIHPYLIPKGSVAVDGISLTIQSLKPKSFVCAIIPHTAQVTTLGAKQPGDFVNLEADMMAKQLFHYLKKYKLRPK